MDAQQELDAACAAIELRGRELWRGPADARDIHRLIKAAWAVRDAEHEKNTVRIEEVGMSSRPLVGFGLLIAVLTILVLALGVGAAALYYGMYFKAVNMALITVAMAVNLFTLRKLCGIRR